MENTQRVIVGISGASGVVFGVNILQILKKIDVETHLVLSKAGALTISKETNYTISELKKIANYTYDNSNIGALCASGTFQSSGMIIAPLSMKSLGEIANGVCSTLLTRSADVILKERKKLIVLPREMPFNLSHIRNMESLTLMGGIIYPPFMSFYLNLKTIDEMVYQVASRAVELLNLGKQIPNIKRWSG